jgi:transposase
MGKSKPPRSKLQALRRQGTLHPRPQQVQDLLFLQNEFFDARDLVQVKYEMLRRVELEHWPVSRSSQVFGLSRPTFYQARAAFRRGGLAGLLPRRRGPRRAHKLSEEVLDFVERLLQADPSLRSPALSERVRERFDVSAHPRSIERALGRRQKKRR